MQPYLVDQRRSGVLHRWVPLVLLVFGAKLSLEMARGEIVICNYEKFHLFDSMYRPRTDNFCVFNDVYLGSDVKGADFLASSLDYRRVAFANSKFPQVPPSLFKNFDDIRELYVRRCSLESLKITRLLEKVYAGGNRIASVQLDGNASNSLRELYLDGNRLQGLANLTNLPALEVLVLENNPLLGNVDFGQFGRMERLWKLDLERIGMSRISNGLKRPLAELRRLDLSNNALTYVHVRMFRTFPKLEHLWLHGNRLYYMEADQVRTVMPSIRSIVIDDNRWGCGHLAALGKQLRDRGIIIRHGDCRAERAIHRVCCSDETDVVDMRYLIEMGIRHETHFQQEVRELRAENDMLRRDLERLGSRLGELMANISRPAEPVVVPSGTEETVDGQESGEHPEGNDAAASFEEYEEEAGNEK
ncbi:nephrocan-like [Anopheles arabiensis]|uniref:Leucine rich immune protein (Short) n=1 Tax=Anopheles arabiensis TaxID=7173 RepID=A0A1Y9GKU2_ANOAR|nr:nephrocan-like [Anopheles arabiensis]